MKSTILIFCLTLLASQLTEATTDNAVFDTSGEEVRRGVYYYINTAPGLLPQFNLTLRWRNIDTDLTVAVEDWGKGIPVTFDPVDPDAEVVTLNTDLHVTFAYEQKWPGPFILPPTWKLRPDGETGKVYVGVQGLEPLADWFKIEWGFPVQGYKFVFGPDVGHDILSGDLGILPDNGEDWLGLAKAPLFFVIKKA